MRLMTLVRYAPVICTSIACAISLYAVSPRTAHATTLTWTTTPGAGNLDGSGTWQDGSGGWNNSAGAATNWSNSNPDSAVVGSANGAAGTINLAGIVAVGNMTFSAPTSGNYIVTDNATATNTLTLPSGGSTVNVASGQSPVLRVNLTDTNTLGSPYGPKLIKNGPGTFTFNLGTGVTATSVVPNNTTIVANNGVMLLGESTAINFPLMSGAAGTNSTLTFAGGEMRTNNGPNSTATSATSLNPNNIALGAGSSQVTQVQGGNNITVTTSIARDVGSTLVVSRGSAGTSGYFKAGTAGIVPYDTSNNTVVGYMFIRNTGGLNTSTPPNGRAGGLDFATTSSGTGTFAAFTGYANTGESTWTTTSIIGYANSAAALTASRDIRGLKVSSNTAGTALDLAGFDLTLEGGGLIMGQFSSNNQNYEIMNSGATGALHGGYDATPGPAVAGNTDTTLMVKDLIVFLPGLAGVPTTSLTISAPIADNTTGAGHVGTAMPTALTKAGPGTLILSGTNTYTGNNYFNDGIVNISSNVNLGDPVTGASINFGSANGSAGIAGTNPVALLATATFGLDNSGSNKRNITIADKGAWLAATSGNTLTVSGVISTLPGMSNAPVTFGVASSGTGTVNLTGNNIYTGTTTVAAGTLLVNGTNSGGGAYTVASGGTLGGSGSIVTANSAGAAVLGGGRLSPGNSPGVLSMDLGTGTLDIRNAITPVNSQSMLFDLDTPATSDQVKLPNAASSLTIGNGNLAFDDFVFTPTANFGSGDYTLFDTNNTISGFFDVFVNLQGVVGGYNAELQMANNNQDIVLHVTTPVPEPSTALLLTLGGLGLLACRRKG